MISDNMKTAIKILAENGFNRNDYQGDEYKIQGELNEYTDASTAMFKNWIQVVVENWPCEPNDRRAKLAARTSADTAIQTLWRIEGFEIE